MRSLTVLMLMSCGGGALPLDSGPTDEPIDPYAGIEAGDAIAPLGVAPGARVVHLMDLTTDGQTAWAAAFKGGLSFDVSDPAAPSLQGTSVGRQLYGVDHSGARVMFSGREAGVLLTERGEDFELSRVARRRDDAEASERAILVGDHVAIAALTDGVIFARQEDLREVSRVTEACPNAFAVATEGDLVFVGDRERGLVILDAADPAEPVEVGVVALRSAAQDLTVMDGIVWVAAGGILEGVDVSDPTAPQIVATLPSGGVATRLDSSDGLLAVAVWQTTRLYDVSTPAEPVLIAIEDATSSATSVALEGDLLLVGDWDDLRTYRVDREARSGEISADSQVVVHGEGQVSTRLLIQNQGNLPLDVTGVSCDDARVVPNFEELRLLPGEYGGVDLVVEAGQGSSFEATCDIANSDVDESSYAFPVRVNPVGLSVGDLAPDFTVADLDGGFHSLSSTRGQVVMITIFSSL
ncbi:MAG: hypothetical protein AB8H79_25960 [Myxococcota bacterium]